MSVSIGGKRGSEGFISNIAVYPHTEIAGEKYAKVAQKCRKIGFRVILN